MNAVATEQTAAWKQVSGLALTIGEVQVEQLELAGVIQWPRVTTIVTLGGNGAFGKGEDVSYDGELQAALLPHYAALELEGDWTIESFSAHLETLALQPPAGERPWFDHPNFQRWTLESAALDLALRQAGLTFAEAIGAENHPLRFCVSMGVGDPPSASKVLDWLKAHPQIEFKLDAARTWDDPLVAALAETGQVKVIDIKGLYVGEWIDNTPDPDLYARLATGFGHDVWLEDAKLIPETTAALGPEGVMRLSWDYALHHPDDLETLPFPPIAINIKPSRFGSLRAIFQAVEWCRQRGIPAYSGGQFELGYGRTQGQQLAACLYPDSPNDIAPVAWHTASPGDQVPLSPLTVPGGRGFGWDA